MDTSSLQPYKDAYSSAQNDVANQTSSAPTLLNQLQQNLTSIFAKDNPFIADRGVALQNYLNAPSQSRVSTLQQNLPSVAGSNLTLSPTQQDAITTSSRNAALVPLLNLNQVVTGMYGNIPQMVGKAGDLYNSQIQAAQARAQGAQTSLAQAMAELKAEEDKRQYEKTLAEKAREFNIEQRNKVSTAGVPSSFFQDLTNSMGLGGGGNSRPPLDAFDQPVYGPPDSYAPQNQPKINKQPSYLSDTLSGLGTIGQNIGNWFGNNFAWPKG